MPARGDFVTVARARTLLQMLCDEYGAGPDFEKTMRVARAMKTDRQRVVTWLRLILAEERATRRQLRTLGFDRSVVDAAASLIKRGWEGVREYARRVATCRDPDALAVAVAVLDDEIDEETVLQRDLLADAKEGRRVLGRAVDARQPGEEADEDRPPEDLSDELLALVDHADGAQAAMRRMLQDSGHGLRGSLERLSPEDRDLLVGHLHDLLQVVGVLVFDVTARADEDPQEDGTALAQARTGGNPTEAMETMALTIAHRLQGYSATPRGDEPETGKGD